VVDLRERTGIDRKVMRKYAPVKIKNPTAEGHLVRLMPRQSFEVICTKQESYDDFNVCVLGDFLILTDVYVEDDKTTFRFKQKYDFTEWAKISALFLGNVIVVKNGGEEPVRVTMCVYCQPTNSCKANVLTVINPDDQLVKIEPNQVLHLVVYDSQEQARWSIEGLFGLNCIRCETVLNDFQNVYDPDSLLCPEPRSGLLALNADVTTHPPHHLPNEIMSNGLVSEYHFWCCLSAEEIRKIHTSPNGSYKMGVVEIRGEYPDRCAIKRFEVMLSLRSSKESLNFDYFTAVHAISDCWKQRSLSYSRHSIFNPQCNENIDVSESDGWFYVEIPAPSVYFDKISEHAQWYPEHKMDDNSPIMCHQLRQRYINGKTVQRFLVTNITVRSSADLLCLGFIKFATQSSEGLRHITLTFWRIPGSSTTYPPFQKDYWQEEERTSKKSLTSIEEVDLELLETKDLTENASIVPLYSIDADGWDEYAEYFGEDYLASLRGSKKKYLPLPLLPRYESNTSIDTMWIETIEMPSAVNIGS
jgi:hypothetical protein